MAAGAGALTVSLGGPAVYHGQVGIEAITWLCKAPTAADIRRAVMLVRRGTFLWLAIVAGVTLLAEVIHA